MKNNVLYFMDTHKKEVIVFGVILLAIIIGTFQK